MRMKRIEALAALALAVPVGMMAGCAAKSTAAAVPLPMSGNISGTLSEVNYGKRHFSIRGEDGVTYQVNAKHSPVLINGRQGNFSDVHPGDSAHIQAIAIDQRTLEIEAKGVAIDSNKVAQADEGGMIVPAGGALHRAAHRVTMGRHPADSARDVLDPAIVRTGRWDHSTAASERRGDDGIQGWRHRHNSRVIAEASTPADTVEIGSPSYSTRYVDHAQDGNRTVRTAAGHSSNAGRLRIDATSGVGTPDRVPGSPGRVSQDITTGHESGTQAGALDRTGQPSDQGRLHDVADSSRQRHKWDSGKRGGREDGADEAHHLTPREVEQMNEAAQYAVDDGN